ncbi:hypothetical protein AMTRI_Chr12g240520 [Amborella trichopoda]
MKTTKFLSLFLLIHIMAVALLISISLIFLGVTVLILVHICIMGRPSSLSSQPSERKQGGLSPKELQKLPCFNYQVGEKRETELSSDCAICLDIFMKGDKCRLLPFCGHSFHVKCVDSWLMKVPRCPVCRAEVESMGLEARDDGSGCGFRCESSLNQRIEVRV